MLPETASARYLDDFPGRDIDYQSFANMARLSLRRPRAVHTIGAQKLRQPDLNPARNGSESWLHMALGSC